MTAPRPSGPSPAPVAADEPAWRPAWGYLIAALAVALLWAWWAWPAEAPSPEPPTPLLATPTTPPTALPLPMAPASRSAGKATQAVATNTPLPSDDLADHVPSGEAPSMSTVIQRLNQAGIYTGLGAFSPPGTRPPLVGLAVPPDFPLPDGYVRHHQTTDDGQVIEPILMFAPDRTFYDSANRPIALPADRVVPPEWAPPGLPIRRIVVPPPLTPERTGS